MYLPEETGQRDADGACGNPSAGERVPKPSESPLSRFSPSNKLIEHYPPYFLSGAGPSLSSPPWSRRCRDADSPALRLVGSKKVKSHVPTASLKKLHPPERAVGG